MIAQENTEAEQRSAAAIDVGLGIIMAGLASVAVFWLVPAEVSTEATGTDVSPAFIPRLAAIVILVLSLGMVAHRVAFEHPAGGWQRGRAIAIETFALCAGAALVSVAIPLVGFLPVAMVVIFAGGLLARYRLYWALALLAVTFPLVVDYGAWAIFFVDLP